jgi:photosystem II stability/assembly factor-like uncharacterized protein
MKTRLLKATLLSTLISFGVTLKGQTWDSIISGIPVSAATNNLPPACFEIFPVNNQTILSAVAGGVYRSTNNGNSWLSVKSGGYNGFKKANNGRILLLGLGGFLGSAISTSDDGGQTWVASISGIDPSSSGNVSIEDASLSPNGTIYIVSRQNRGVYASTDNGNTWVEKAVGIAGSTSALWSILAIDDNTIIVGASNGIYRSTDAGTSWTLVQGTGSGYVMTLKKNSLGNIYAGLASGVVRKSVNNGLTWTNTTFTGSSSSVYDIEIDNSDNIYISIFLGGIVKYNSSDMFAGALGTTTNGLANTRVTDLSIDESGSNPLFYACCNSTTGTGGCMYRLGLPSSVGLEKLNDLNTISISPNPANQSIQIQGVDFSEGVRIKIISIDGKIMKDEMINQSNISISDLNSGMYFMELTDSNDKTGITKFIKE